MKRIIAMVLALVMVFALCACGKKSQIDYDNAIVASPTEVWDDVEENAARAMQNTYKINCVVNEITTEYFTSSEMGSNIRFFLDTDELANLNIGDNVTVIGIITEVSDEQTQVGYETHIDFKDAELL